MISVKSAYMVSKTSVNLEIRLKKDLLKTKTKD